MAESPRRRQGRQASNAVDDIRISVIIPAHNGQDMIGTAISSVLQQTRPAHEVVVVDDGSTDRTAQIVEAYGPSVTLLRQENKGSAGARNTAIAATTGTHIAWLDADDQFLPRYLQQATEELRRQGPRTIVTTDALRVTPAGIPGRRILPSPFPAPSQQRLRMLENNFVGVFSVYPRTLHDEVGPIPEHVRYAEDRQFWLAAVFHGWTVVRAPEPMALYRWMGGSKSNAIERRTATEHQMLGGLLEDERFTLTPAEEAYLRMRLQADPPRKVLAAADQALRDRDFSQARTLLRQAAQLLPGDSQVQTRARIAATGVGLRALAWKLAQTDRAIGWHPGMNH